MNFEEFFNKNKEFVLLTPILVVFFLFFIFSINSSNLNDKKIDQNFSGEKESIIEKPKVDYESVLKNIKAKSFCVYDFKKDEIVFSKNENLQLPLASITKLMSGFVVMDILPESTIVEIKTKDILEEGDSGLVVGENWKLKDLLDFSLITSSNDGMHAISSVLNNYKSSDGKNTIILMNERAKEIGLVNTVFMNETGLDIDKNLSGAYSSAYDVSLLLKKILKENISLISDTTKDIDSFVSESNITHVASNTNISINNIPNILLSKTGYTDLAGGNLAIVFDAGFSYPVSVVVLGSTIEERFSDVEKLVNLTLQKLSE